jgi:hypothetical protein
MDCATTTDTVRDSFKAAGASVSTAFRVLSKRAAIPTSDLSHRPSACRQDRLDHTPNPSPKSLRSHRMHTIVRPVRRTKSFLRSSDQGANRASPNMVGRMQPEAGGWDRPPGCEFVDGGGGAYPNESSKSCIPSPFKCVAA